ncbi:MAG: hypothetical protein ACE5JI_03690 [Acidobacteriota bacterium]
MKFLSAGSALLAVSLVSTVLFGEEKLLDVVWSQWQQEGRLATGELIEEGGAVPRGWLRLEQKADASVTFTVLTLDSPGITRARYAIQGEVGYEGIEGKGYLEMWGHFPDGSRYFSRTVSPSGPMKSLRGSSEPRRFVLPFYNDEGAEPPEKLVLNVVLPGRGTVYLSPLRLVQYGPTEDPLGGSLSAGQWSGRRAGLLGGLGGAALGCLGALMGWLASAGKARGFVLGGMKTLMLLGMVAMLLGVTALVRAAPYTVYYPLLLLGLLAVLVPAFTLPAVRRRYEELELRKMRAWDAR